MTKDNSEIDTTFLSGAMINVDVNKHHKIITPTTKEKVEAWLFSLTSVLELDVIDQVFFTVKLLRSHYFKNSV